MNLWIKNRSPVTPVGAAIVFGIALITQFATAQDEAPSKPKIEMQSVYLAETIGRAHQIELRGELGGKGVLTLDPNTCTVTQFGDRGICTRIAALPVEVKLEQLRLADPTGHGRRLFQLIGNVQPSDAKFFLVVPRWRSEPHRLIVDLSEDLRRVVTLEPIPAPPRGKPELCKNAKYRATQSEGKVTLFAKGEHPTAGWKVGIEQLPLRIFPPQYRLVCFPPRGNTAQVVTPFETSTSFQSEQPVTQITIHDRDGQHKVPVQQE